MVIGHSRQLQYLCAIMKPAIPVYDICSLSMGKDQQDLLIERLNHYLQNNYQKAIHQHGHSFYHLVLFTKGSGSHTLDFTKFSVQPYQVYFMIPGQVHNWHFSPDTDGYVIHFSETFFRSFLMHHDYLERFSFFSGDSKDQVLNVPVPAREEVKALFEKLVAEMETLQYDMIRVLMLQLFLLIERTSVKEKKKAIPQQKLLVLRNFRQLINKHYRTIKLPKEYAELLYITPNHLNALCQDLLGKTAGELIRERVLLEAKRMLTNADLTVTQIAYELNFQDNSYFNRFFKKYIGITPDDFRKSLNN